MANVSVWEWNLEYKQSDEKSHRCSGNVVVSKNAQDTMGGQRLKWAGTAEGRCREGDYEEHKKEVAEIPGPHHEGTTTGEPMPYR